MSDVLLTGRAAGILWLTMNRPERKNAVSPDLREAIIEALAEAAADGEVRCAVLTGAGGAFCTGVDLAASAAGQSPGPDGRPDPETVRVATRDGMHRLVEAIREFPKPILAMVHGVAAGAGVQLALACDLVLAGESARFIELFVRRGLVVDSGGSWLLPRLVGPARAKELVFFGDAVPAAEAERMGLVNRAVPDAELEPTVREWAGRLARSATAAIVSSKRLLNDGFGRTFAEALEAEAAAQGAVSQTGDFVEGVRSFLQKRPPEFTGR